MKVIREFPTRGGSPVDTLPEVIYVPLGTKLLYARLVGDHLSLWGECPDIPLDQCFEKKVRVNFYNVNRPMLGDAGEFLCEVDLGDTYIPCFVYIKEEQ